MTHREAIRILATVLLKAVVLLAVMVLMCIVTGCRTTRHTTPTPQQQTATSVSTATLPATTTTDVVTDQVTSTQEETVTHWPPYDTSPPAHTATGLPPVKAKGTTTTKKHHSDTTHTQQADSTTLHMALADSTAVEQQATATDDTVKDASPVAREVKHSIVWLAIVVMLGIVALVVYRYARPSQQ